MECWVNPFKTHTYIHLCHVHPFHWFLPSPFPSRSLVGERVHSQYFGWCCRGDGQRCLHPVHTCRCSFLLHPPLSFFPPYLLPLLPSSLSFPIPLLPPFPMPYPSPPSPRLIFPSLPTFPSPSPPLFPPSFQPIHHLLGFFVELHLVALNLMQDEHRRGWGGESKCTCY